MKFHIIILSTLCSIQLLAENKVPPTPEEMQAKKWEHMVQNAQLTSEEILAVKPIYTQYESAIWELHKKNRLNKRRTPLSNYEELNERYIELEVKQAELLLNYHLELKKVLTPERLYNYYKAERSHKRKLIHEMHDKFPPKGLKKPVE